MPPHCPQQHVYNKLASPALQTTLSLHGYRLTCPQANTGWHTNGLHHTDSHCGWLASVGIMAGSLMAIINVAHRHHGSTCGTVGEPISTWDRLHDRH